MYGLHDPCILKSNKYDPTKMCDSIHSIQYYYTYIDSRKNITS